MKVKLADSFTESPASGQFSASLDGTLAFSAGSFRSSQFAWFDRTGRQLSTSGPLGDYQQPVLSPDDRFVAFQRGGGATDIWVLDLGRGVTSPVTSHPERDTSPVWSPDSRTIAFDSSRGGRRAVYQRTFGTVGDDMLMLQTSVRNLSDWSRDGRFLVYEDGTNIWALSQPVAAGATPTRISEDNAFAKNNPRISPDVRWIAYESREPADVYIQSFPEPGLKVQVSRGGGTQPNWSRDGKELFYLASDRTLTSVSIKPSGASLELGQPVPLFQPRFDIPPTRGYSVSADGRFLMSVPGSQSSATTVILNWARGLKK